MTVGDATTQEWYRSLIYKAGTTYKSKSGITGLVEAESTTFSTVFNACLGFVGVSGQNIAIYPDQNYQIDSTLSLTSANHYARITGWSDYQTSFIPQTDTAVFDITACSYFDINGINFMHNRVGYTTVPLININQLCTDFKIHNCQFFDSGAGYRGYATRFYVPSGQDWSGSFGRIYDNFYRNLNCCFYYETAGGRTQWISGITYQNNVMSNLHGLEKTNLATGTSAGGNTYTNIMWQTGDATAYAAFDWDDAGAHSGHMSNVWLWDLNGATQYFAKLNANSRIYLSGCVPTMPNKFSGSGFNNGASILNYDGYMAFRGLAAFAGDGTTTDFVVTVGSQWANTPTNVRIYPHSRDAARSYYISAMAFNTFTVSYLKAPPPSANPADANNIKFGYEMFQI